MQGADFHFDVKLFQEKSEIYQIFRQVILNNDKNIYLAKIRVFVLLSTCPTHLCMGMLCLNTAIGANVCTRESQSLGIVSLAKSLSSHLKIFLLSVRTHKVDIPHLKSIHYFSTVIC